MRNVKITFSTQEEKDSAVEAEKVAQDVSAKKHADWLATLEASEIVPE